MEGRDRLTAAGRWMTAAALAAAVGAPVALADGPAVTSAPSIGQDAVREAAWAGFFRGLPHGKEIGTLNVLLGGEDDVRGRCGPSAGGCYLPLPRLIVMPGGALPGGGLSDEIARHEYGHHLAAESDNAPFAAGLGTKRWFTHEHICERLRSGELVDDAGESYERSVAEGFAEAYRVAAGGQAHDWIVDSGLYPDALAQRSILTDARHPWSGPRVQRFAGRAPAKLTLQPQLDGNVTVKASRRLRLRLTDARGLRLAGGRRSLRYVDCGKRWLTLEVAGARPGRRFSLTVSTP
jgi:hypothetical protein